MLDQNLQTAYRRCFFDGDNPYGRVVFADMMERSGLFDDLFINGDRPDPKNDNAYLQGRESFFLDILNIMGISGPDQSLALATALSGVMPAEIENQKFADNIKGEKNNEK